MLYGGCLWTGSDFWSALAAGAIADPERRAVECLRRLCDPVRFASYCRTGRMPAMGNVTRGMYVVRRSGGVVELDGDGEPKATWCISVNTGEQLPPTDNVLMLKCLLEGEEMSLREIGNRSQLGSWSGTPEDDALAPQRSRAPEDVGTAELMDYDWPRAQLRRAMEEAVTCAPEAAKAAIRNGIRAMGRVQADVAAFAPQTAYQMANPMNAQIGGAFNFNGGYITNDVQMINAGTAPIRVFAQNGYYGEQR